MWAAAQMAEVHRVHLGSICINAPASAKLAASLELWSFNMKYRHPIGIFFWIQYSALCVTSNETNTEIKWLISNKIKPFKSTSYIWSSEGFIQCKISFVLVSLLSLLLTVQSSCIIHEDRFGNTKNHRIGKEVIYCPKEGLVIRKPFLTPSNGQSPQSIFQLLSILRELFSIPF